MIDGRKSECHPFLPESTDGFVLLRLLPADCSGIIGIQPHNLLIEFQSALFSPHTGKCFPACNSSPLGRSVYTFFLMSIEREKGKEKCYSSFINTATQITRPPGSGLSLVTPPYITTGDVCPCCL